MSICRGRGKGWGHCTVQLALPPFVQAAASLWRALLLRFTFQIDQSLFQRYSALSNILDRRGQVLGTFSPLDACGITSHDSENRREQDDEDLTASGGPDDECGMADRR